MPVQNNYLYRVETLDGFFFTTDDSIARHMWILEGIIKSERIVI